MYSLPFSPMALIFAFIFRLRAVESLRFAIEDEFDSPTPQPAARVNHNPGVEKYHETRSASPAPLVIIICGLDAYRTDLAVYMEGFRHHGVTALALDIPSTGDCPANRSDPTSTDRLFTSLFEWIAQQSKINQKKNRRLGNQYRRLLWYTSRARA
ncbi:hypothetical protein P280DRAFT_550120 [Massarina eburnea CBS 473.64]|uniref:Uncharacterized protein n=1 Tax=Massarina eburnea CBS 473.64 TaxID=1395130 RepID=A0A6A6RZ14_9PLEO|nr:hypothetical protein P280DRAFT_550120 [Massarina eburnea CBS 473.64]